MIWGSCLILILALQVGVTLTDRSSDPPLGPSDLEGQLLLGARALLPDQTIPMGEWAPHLVAPLYVAAHVAGFRILGVGLEAARIVNALCSVLVVILLFALVRRSSGAGVAVLASVFLVANPVFFSLSRVALPAILSLLAMLTAIAATVLGSRRAGWAIPGGLLIGIAATWAHPTHNLFFLGAGVLVLLAVRLHAWKMDWRPRTSRRVHGAALGILLALVVPVALLVLRPEAYRPTWEHFSWGSWRLLAANVVLTPVALARLVELMPLTTLLALGYFLFFAKDVVRPIVRHRELDEVRLWMLAWILAGVPFFFLVSAPPLEALALLVPPLCVLAAEGVARLFRLRRLERPRIDVMIVMLLIAGSTWLLVATTVQVLLGDRDPGGFWSRHQIRTSWLIVFPVWIGLTALFGWLWLRWKRFTIPLRPAPVLVLVLGVSAAVPVLGISEMVRWWGSRTHEVEAATAPAAGLLPTDLVVGSWAPLLTLGHEARAALIWPGLNDEPRDWHREVTHLVLEERREVLPGTVSLPRAAWGPGNDPPPTLRGRRLTWYRVLR